MNTTSVSFSLDAATKAAIDEIAKKEKKSRSDVLRDVFARYRLERAMLALQAEAASKLQAFGLKTEEDIADYVKQH